jgi:phage recombination protein Bet
MSTNVPAKGEKTAMITGPRVPFHPVFESQFGIDKIKYTALVNAIFPNAQSADSIFLALSYCKARNLDVFKRNVHIVPIWDSKRKQMVDTIWPGIGELRTTAFRTGEYAGRGETEFGQDLTQTVGKVEMTFPEWARVTVSRLVKGNKVAFVGPKVYWIETYAVYSRDDESPNSMWRDRPRGQLEKCAEAAALRAAFPEEIGGDLCSDEVGGGKVLDVSANAVLAKNNIDSVTNMITGSNDAGDQSGGNDQHDDGHQETSHDSEAGEDAAENQDSEPADDEAGKLVATFNKELAACKRKGELEGLLDEINTSPDWQSLRDRAKLFEACTEQINKAIARLKSQQ